MSQQSWITESSSGQSHGPLKPRQDRVCGFLSSWNLIIDWLICCGTLPTIEIPCFKTKF